VAGGQFGLTRQAVKAALDRQGDTGPRRRGRGFAALSAEERRRISSLGGKAAHAKGKAHRFTGATAAAAGRKGAKAAHQRGTAHRFGHEQASAAGKKGGRARERKRGDQRTSRVRAASSAACRSPTASSVTFTRMSTAGSGSPVTAASACTARGWRRRTIRWSCAPGRRLSVQPPVVCLRVERVPCFTAGRNAVF
jgi:hypothetical protein